MSNETRGAKVVVVDDSPVNRALLGEMLEGAGYQVSTASNGTDALTLVAQSSPDLMLLDIQMPEMSGYEVCRRLKASPRFGELPVIFISALDDVFDKVQAFEAGGIDYIGKPFEPAEVLARVGTQVKVSRLQRELRQRNAELQRRNEQLIATQQKTERVFSALSEALPGTVLDDTYRLETRIGEGGYGAVYRALHVPLRRPVAVKVLRPVSVSRADVELARFRREGMAACRVAHPNAVEVLDFRISNSGIAYLVMELLEGRTLGSLLREEPVQPVRRCSAILAPVCEVLAAAHAGGLVHRDIKPDNIFLHRGPSGEVVKLVDFGIARLMSAHEEQDSPELGEVTVKGSIIGTPLYMAPERFLGSESDERSDVYSVGMLLYLMLTGQPPFPIDESLSAGKIGRLHLTATPRAPQELQPDVPPAVAALAIQALEKEPARRPSAKELGEKLRVAAA